MDQSQIKALRAWIRFHAPSFLEDMGEGLKWYNDCDMIDSAIHDLDLEDHRKQIGDIIEKWILTS